MNYDILQRAAGAMHLDILGAFHPAADDPDLTGFGTLVMLSPLSRAFGIISRPNPSISTTYPTPSTKGRPVSSPPLPPHSEASPFSPSPARPISRSINGR